MKLRNGLIFLMIVVLASVWLPASAETSDFPFLPGLNWSSTVQDVESAVGTPAEADSQNIGNSGRMIYFKVNNPGLAPAPYELGVTLTAGDVMSMAIFLYDVSSASDKDAVRGQILDETEKLYEGRGEVMFDTPENMKQAFEGKSDISDTILGTALGGLEGAIKDMYGSTDEIVRVKGWLVNREYSVLAAYSTEGSRKDVVAVIMVNIEPTLAMMMDASLPANRTGCLDLPAGASWMCSRETLAAALSNAGISYEADDSLYQVGSMNGPAGSPMAAMYIFQEDALMGALYIVSMTFDNLEQVMIQEYGSKAEVDTETIRQQIESFIGMPATRASVWITTDSLCYLFECTQGNIIMEVSTQLLMQQ